MQAQNPSRLPIVPYISDTLNEFAPVDTFGTVSSFTVDTDWLVPFIVREPVTIDNLFWHRANTTAGNVYMAILDSLGNRLTDCAVDNNTVADYHLISTTPVTLYPGRVYYGAFNQSVLVASRDTPPTAFATWFQQFAVRSDMCAVLTVNPDTRLYSKARANAAFPAQTTMTGWTVASLLVVGGFVKQ